MAGRRNAGGNRGQTLLELLLVLPVLLALLFGFFEYARLFSARLTVAAAAREGARYAIVGDRTDWEIAERVRDFAVNLPRSQLAVAVERLPAGAPEVVRVTVSCPVEIVLPPVRQLLPNPVVVTGTAAMRRE